MSNTARGRYRTEFRPGPPSMPAVTNRKKQQRKHEKQRVQHTTFTRVSSEADTRLNWVASIGSEVFQAGT